MTCAAVVAVGPIATGKPAEIDFTAMSLDQLGALKVTLVSKKAERLYQVPAAVSVITSNDIQRSGALTFPELLRMAPGLSVGKVDAAQWAVSVRGFNDTFAQKLLVLMDGRSVYTPLFSGTFWQVQDTMLEDVDRVEVVRGPGATVWGANAVNGVINVVSKPARETQGVLLSGGSGSRAVTMAGARYGAQLGENAFFRIYGKADHWRHSQRVGGAAANDAWSKDEGGFRLDWEPASADRLTLQGDVFERRSNQNFPQVVLPVFRVPPPATGYNFTRDARPRQNGGNLLGRWSHMFSEQSDLTVQGYYDRAHMNFLLLGETRDTYDLDFRHRFQSGRRNEIVWGGGFRLSSSHLTDSVEVTLSKKSRSDRIFNAFVQDEITLVPDRLRWTLGSKIEHNDYTGFEIQPGMRLSWTPADRRTIWVSLARAVRTPSQVEHDGRFNLAVLPPSPLLPVPSVVSANGNTGFQAETLLAYEVGYRVQPHRRLTLDAAAFVNAYDKLRGSDERLDLSKVPNYAQVQSVIDNGVHGRTYGGELAATLQAAGWWRLHGQVSVIHSELRQPPSRLTGAPRTPSVASPEYQLAVRSNMDLGRGVALDIAARHVDGIPVAGVAIPGQPVAGYRIPSYTTFDVRLSWRPSRNLELSAVGQDLAGAHREFVPTFTSTQFTEVTPGAYAKLTVKF